MSLTRQDRLTIGRSRAHLNRAIRQLDLALERGADRNEATQRLGAATIIARDGVDICRRLFLALDKRDGDNKDVGDGFEGAEADTPARGAQ